MGCLLDLAGLFGSAFLSATLLPGSSELAFIALLKQNLLSPLLLIIVATLGNTLGSVTTYAIGRWCEDRFRWLHPSRWSGHQAELMLRRYGIYVLLFAWLPLIGDAFCFIAGMLRLSLASSIICIAFGKGARYLLLWHGVLFFGSG